MFDIYFSTTDTLRTWTRNEIITFWNGYCDIYYDGVIKKEDTRVESTRNNVDIRYSRCKDLASNSSHGVSYVIVVYENKIS